MSSQLLDGGCDRRDGLLHSQQQDGQEPPRASRLPFVQASERARGRVIALRRKESRYAGPGRFCLSSVAGELVANDWP